GEPVHTTYNPLVYARAPHAKWLETWGAAPRETLWLGMNPGPFGMAQTGVPFGDVVAVRDWLGIEAAVGTPPIEHPKRPIVGFAMTRREGSGKRLWGWAEERFGTPDVFFADHFVHNYCPLLFMHETGRNIVPEKLKAAEREPLFEACDEALRDVVRALGVTRVVGIGVFAEKKALEALDGMGLEIGRILHPSPASPAANAGWAERVEPTLEAMGVTLP
ncbi:MAG: single-strand selective monofunctional uracil DNA glycosylase, partial [Flavobacteriales bacterium]